MQTLTNKKTRVTQSIQIDSQITELKGKLLQDRFQIGTMMVQGNSSYIFKCQDDKNPKMKQAIKVSDQVDEMSLEVKTLVKLRKV